MIRIHYERKDPVFNKRKNKFKKIKNNPTHYLKNRIIGKYVYGISILLCINDKFSAQEWN